jgi:hypothetical protein
MMGHWNIIISLWDTQHYLTIWYLTQITIFIRCVFSSIRVLKTDRQKCSVIKGLLCCCANLFLLYWKYRNSSIDMNNLFIVFLFFYPRLSSSFIALSFFLSFFEVRRIGRGFEKKNVNHTYVSTLLATGLGWKIY